MKILLNFFPKPGQKKKLMYFIDEAEKVVEKLKEGKFKLYQKYSKDIRSALIGKNT